MGKDVLLSDFLSITATKILNTTIIGDSVNSNPPLIIRGSITQNSPGQEPTVVMSTTDNNIGSDIIFTADNTQINNSIISEKIFSKVLYVDTIIPYTGTNDNSIQTINTHISGNSNTTNSLLNSINISLSGDISGIINTDLSTDVEIEATVSDNSHFHDDSTLSNINWSKVLSKPSPKINLTGGISGYAVLTDLSTDMTISTTVADNSHSHDDSTLSNINWSKVLSKPSPVFTLTGDVDGTAVFDELSSDLTITTTVANNSHTHNNTTIDSLDWSKVFNKPSPVITLMGDVTGTFTFTNLSSDITLVTTVSDNSHLHDNSSIVSVDWSKILNKPDPLITLTGDLTGSGTLNDLNSVTIDAQIIDDSHNHTNLTGTTSSLYSINTINLKDTSGVLEVRNKVDSGYADLKVNNLTVAGTTLIVQSETVTFNDNTLILNNNYTGSAPTENGGFEIERGTITNSTLIWDESNDSWKCGLVGSEDEIILASKTQTLTNKTITGSLIGNASSASKLINPFTLTLSGNVTGSINIDGSSNVTLNTTVTGGDSTSISGNTISNIALLNGLNTFTNLNTFNNNITLSNGAYITKTTTSGNANWMQQDGTGRQHWYWNTNGGNTPTFTKSGEDALDLMMHSDNSGATSGFLKFRASTGFGKNANDSITWDDIFTVNSNNILFKTNTVYHSGMTTFNGNALTSTTATKLNNMLPDTLATASTIAARDSSGNLTANIFNGTATTAKYADLAEKYTCIDNLENGTVVKVSTCEDYELDLCTPMCKVAGVITDKPAFLMNKDSDSGLIVGLVGKVRVKIVGPIKKGDIIIPDNNGIAKAGNGGSIYDYISSFGAALETNMESEIKLVLCKIG